MVPARRILAPSLCVDVPLGAANQDCLGMLADGQVGNVGQGRTLKKLPLVHKRGPLVKVEPPDLEMHLHDPPGRGQIVNDEPTNNVSRCLCFPGWVSCTYLPSSNDATAR